MEIVTKFNGFVFPQASLMTIGLNVRNGLIPEVVDISEILGDYGITRYNGQQMIDMYTLNEILYEFVDLSDLEFEIVCAILYARRLGDLCALNWACKILKSGQYEYIKITPDDKGTFITKSNLADKEQEFIENGFINKSVNVLSVIEKALWDPEDESFDNSYKFVENPGMSSDSTNETDEMAAAQDNGEALSYDDMILLMDSGYEQCSRGFLSLREGVR